MTAHLVLASTSPTRAALLRAAGAAFETETPRVDEDEVKAALRAEGATPRDQSDALAEMKALRVSGRRPGAFVLGADQVLDLHGAALDKPAGVDEARDQLLSLKGETHALHSAAVIAVDGAPVWRHIGRARLTMRPFSDAFLADYLEALGDDVMSTAGGYKIEGLGAQLFARIDGDHFAIQGLPLLEVLDFLRVRGVMAA